MSADNPLVIDFAAAGRRHREAQATLRRLLDDNRFTATHVRIKFIAAADLNILNRNRLGAIARELPGLTHVTLEFFSVVFNRSNFPVEVLGELFRARADTLVSLKAEAPDWVHLEGSRSNMQQVMRDLAQVQNLQELDLSCLSWIVVPEIHTSSLPEGHTADLSNLGRRRVGFVVDPTAEPTFDPNILIAAVNSMPTLHKLSLLMKGCDMEQAYSTLQGLTETKFLTSLEIQFFTYRSPNSSEDRLLRLCTVLESTLEMNLTLKNLKVIGCAFSSKHNDTRAFWLKMNNAGRKSLLADPNDHKRWVETLVEQKNDCRATFFLLSTNLAAYLPSMLDGSSEGSARSSSASDSTAPVQKKCKLKG